jgi:hypothetical protein
VISDAHEGLKGAIAKVLHQADTGEIPTKRRGGPQRVGERRDQDGTRWKGMTRPRRRWGLSSAGFHLRHPPPTPLPRTQNGSRQNPKVPAASVRSLLPADNPRQIKIDVQGTPYHLLIAGSVAGGAAAGDNLQATRTWRTSPADKPTEGAPGMSARSFPGSANRRPHAVRRVVRH